MNINEWADFWFYTIGANVIPSDTKNKKTSFRWSEFKENPISEEMHEQIKIEGGYEKGVAIMTGMLYRGPYREKYIVGIDIDNKKGAQELLSYYGETGTLEKLAEKTIVEQHADNKEKAHVYFVSSIPFPNKGANSELGLEIKSMGGHGIMFCSPSIHKDGHPYKIMGTKSPAVLNFSESIGIMQHIDGIFKKHGLSYLEKKSPLSEKIKNATKRLKINSSLYGTINEGERHATLLSIANSILFNHYEPDKDMGNLKKFFNEINEKLCTSEPLPLEEINSIWNSALAYVKQNKDCANDNSQKSGSRKKEKVGVIEAAATEIMNNNHFITIEESKEILFYFNGVYVPGGEILIESLAEDLFEYDITNDIIEEIKGHIMRKTYLSIKSLDRDINTINLRNGLYDISKNELRPHSPHYPSINQKPIVYDKGAKPKMFGKFLRDVLYSVEIRTAIEVMAYTFYRDCPFEHFFKLFGHGANGKSVFTGLLTKLHGIKNVSNVPLTSLIDNRFAAADLEFKDVNIDAELSAAVIKDTSLLKKLTGGRKQPIRIEQKYKSAYDTYLYAKLFFNANTITDTTDQTAAYYRRQIIISFPNTFEGKKDDPQLLDKLTSKEEMSGIFNVAMRALRTLLKNNGIYLNEKSIEARTAKHERAVNPVRGFVAEAIADDSTEIDYTIKADLYRAFKKYCKKYSLPPKSEIALGKDLKKLGWADGRESHGEKRRTCWIGIKLKSEFVCVDEQQQVTLWTK